LLWRIFNPWQDDIATPDTVDGYTVGHEMTFKWYDASAGTESEFIPPPGIMAVDDDPVAPDHSGFGCGLYGRRSFSQGVGSVHYLPQEFHLKQNYPNPFNGTTVIPLELPQRSNVRVELFNVRGQNLGIMYDGIQNAGWPKISYNASALSSGIYFYRVTEEGLELSGNFQSKSKMLLLK
jgi:hypothetical protein